MWVHNISVLLASLTILQLEWLVAIPWPGSSVTAPSTSLDTLRDRNFLKKTRQQLDDDHYGLEKIKKRLIEYLAVVRLKALQADREAAALQASKAESSSDGSAAPVKETPRRNTVKGPILLYVPSLSLFFTALNAFQIRRPSRDR